MQITALVRTLRQWGTFAVLAGSLNAAAAPSQSEDANLFDSIPIDDQESLRAAASEKKPVVGTYFPEWGVYDRAFEVDQVPFDKITHFLYAFIPICGNNQSLKDANPSGFAILERECASKRRHEITIHDTFAATQPPHNNFGKLAAAKAAHPKVSILPSIGGWSLSDPFHEMASTRANRAIFIASCLKFLQTWTFFDGIDIDWEYPGGGGANANVGGAEDRANHVALLKELRQALDDLGVKNNRKYLLTSAVGGAPSKIDFVDYQALFADKAKPTLDLVFAMTYDFYGAWSGIRGNFAGLYDGSNKLMDGFNGAAAIQNLLQSGVPAANLVLGVAMYGRAWEGIESNHALSTSVEDASGRPFAVEHGMWEAGVMDYKFIAKRYRNDPAFTYVYDKQAKAPYLWSSSLKKLISYEDKCSAKAKMDYVKKIGLAGTFAWEIDADNGDILSTMNGGSAGNCP